MFKIKTAAIILSLWLEIRFTIWSHRTAEVKFIYSQHLGSRGIFVIEDLSGDPKIIPWSD